MMRFDVGTLLRGAVGYSQVYEIDEALERRDSADPTEKITGTVSLMKTGRGVLVKADLRTRAEMNCSRCLKPMNVLVDISFQEEYVATADPRTGAPLPPPEDDDDSFLIDEQQVLDISEGVRQYWMVGQPIQALCQQECKGLCPQCGSDLNSGGCSCRSEDIDTRLIALSRVREGLKKAIKE